MNDTIEGSDSSQSSQEQRQSSKSTVAVPTEPLIDYLTAIVREGIGEFHDHTSPPERDVDDDVEWSWEDADWEIESLPEKNELSIRGLTEGKYSVKTRSATYNPPGKAHPAEYEQRTMPVAIDITVDLTDGYDLDLGEPHVEVYHA